jgi:hypothetical protein
MLRAKCPYRCPEYSEYSERKREGPTGERLAFKVSWSLGKLMLHQLSYSRSGLNALDDTRPPSQRTGRDVFLETGQPVRLNLLSKSSHLGSDLKLSNTGVLQKIRYGLFSLSAFFSHSKASPSPSSRSPLSTQEM